MSSAANRPRVGVLAVQGAFAEQEKSFQAAGADTFEIRELADIARPFDALVLPGGESTVQGKLLKDLGLFAPLKERIAAGLPTFATCAGLILLAEKLAGDPTVWFGELAVTVARNAYGRQLGSFTARGAYGALQDVPMTFIRAPRIEAVGPGVETLSTHAGSATAVRQGAITALAWHPELTADTRVFHDFLARL